MPDFLERRRDPSSGENLLAQPKLAALYDSMTLITGGPLSSGARLVEIWRLHTGALDID